MWYSSDDSESTYDPDNKWDHIYWLMVHGAEAINWWYENYVLHAQDIRHRIDTLDSKLDKDAPIAASQSEHPMGVLKSGVNSFGVAQTKGGGKDKNERKRPATTAVEAYGAEHRAPKAGGGKPPAGPRTHASKKCGGWEICRGFINGTCSDVDATGSCGPFSCKHHAGCIHACSTCGGTGHEAKDCSFAPAGAGKKQQRAPKGKGKGKKGKKGNKG